MNKLQYLSNGSYLLQGSLQSDPLKVITIAVSTVESVFDKNEEYLDVMSKFPGWTFAMQQQADVSSYEIKEEA